MSEQATTAEGLAVWKVGACQAVVAVVTVLRWWSVVGSVSFVGVLTIDRCMRRVGGRHFLFHLEEACIHSGEVEKWFLITPVSSCTKIKSRQV